MYAFRADADPVELAFTDRHGGVSVAPFDSLNLALRGDDPDALSENLRRLRADFGPEDALAEASQVHSATVVHADQAGDGMWPRADGLVADRPGVTLVIRVADCVPVLFADPDRGVIGGAHAGRDGMAKDVVGATVTAMRDLGAERISAWVGPHVCGACYEVPAELRDEVAALVPASAGVTSWGTPALDLGAGVRSQLGRAGVESVTEVGVCTLESSDLFSYRRDGAGSGRLAGVIRRKR